MRIGLFTDTYMPQINGVATSVRMLKEYLEPRGHEVYIFTTTDPHATRNEDGVFRIPSLPFVSERRIAMFYHPLVARSARLLRLDIIHTHTEFSLGIFGRKLARTHGIPIVHTMHTIYEDYTHYVAKLNALEPMAKTVAKKVSISSCNLSDAVIAPTNKVKKMLRGYGVSAEINVIPTGIKLEKFNSRLYDENCVNEMRSELGLKINDKVILYIGRISEEKNMDELLIGLKDYIPARKDVKFVIIGDGPYRLKLEHMAKDLGIERNVIFAGEKPWDDIGKYYQVGDLFVSASQSESQGLTYIEAMAAGLPLIVKKDPCLEGVALDGVNGYTFNDKTEFIRQLDKVLSDDELQGKLSTGALSTAQMFSASHYANSVESIYRSVRYRNALYRPIGYSAG